MNESVAASRDERDHYAYPNQNKLICHEKKYKCDEHDVLRKFVRYMFANNIQIKQIKSLF